MIFKKRELTFGRKGIADTQFHWLFVILAGGFIFFFFAIFINQGIAANQNKQTALMLQYMDGILSSSQNIQNLNDVIESTPSITLEQKCSPDSQSKLVFVDQDLDKKTTFLPIFSNHRINGAAYPYKTMPYVAPFLVDNPLYLTDTSTLYVVYHADPVVREKYVKLLPSNAAIVSTDSLPSITENGFRDVIIITDGETSLGSVKTGQHALPSALLSANVRQVDVESDSNEVYFYYKFDVTGDTIMVSRSDLLSDPSAANAVTYSDDATLLGGIMSEDPELYNCNKLKLDERTRVIAMQVFTRAGQLSDAVTDSRCKLSYDTVRDTISSALQTDSLADVSTRDAIVGANEQLKFYACPVLY